jgi:hypothetical protein
MTMLCEKCKREIEVDEYEHKLLDILPKGTALHDFGGGMTVMPVPDLAGQKPYLISHMAAMIGRRDGQPLTGKETGQEDVICLAFEIIPMSPGSANDLQKALLSTLPKVLKLWPERAVDFSEAIRGMVSAKELEAA